MANWKYAAPEQREQRNIDHLADIYALGLILSEMFTGHLAQGTNYKKVASVAPEFAYVDDLISVMIEYEPAQRPQSIREVKRQLTALGNKYIAELELRGAEGKVVERHSVDEPIEPTIVGADYRNGTLVLEFDIVPDLDWVQALKFGRYNREALMGSPPEVFNFKENTARVTVRPSDTQQVVDFFKSWIPKATDIVRRERQRAADKRQQQEEMELRKQQENVTTRLKVLKNLKF